MKRLSHLDPQGRVRMVDVGAKPATRRTASAEAFLRVGPDILRRLEAGDSPKGNVFETARIAGIQGAKRTADLIPLCHLLPLDHVNVEFRTEREGIRIEATAATRAATGVEMEALVAVTTAALTLYDMLKAWTHDMVLEKVRLLSKSGGRSGDYRAPEPPSRTPRARPKAAASTGKRRRTRKESS
jgi:cyclic pyranopterin phosphate synthase